MKLPAFNQTKNLAFAQTAKRGGAWRREHLNQRLTLWAKRRLRPGDLPQDNRFFDFKRDFHFLFHLKKYGKPVKIAGFPDVGG
jgi:hypothetical protein